MAAISWMVNGAQVTELEYNAFQVQRATDLERWLLSGAGQPIATGPVPPDPISPLDVHAITGSNLSGQLNKIPLTFVQPWGWIPSGTTSLADAHAQGFRYLSGQWVNTRVVQPPSVIGIPTATTVPTVTTVSSAGPRPSALTAIADFLGGPMGQVRMTTGIGAEGGALAPIRFGMFPSALPRIVMDEIAT